MEKTCATCAYGEMPDESHECGQCLSMASSTAVGYTRWQPLEVKQVGDVNSTERGSGARYNAGKPPLELIPLKHIATYYQPMSSDATAAQLALDAIGDFQATRDTACLVEALRLLGDGWDECARVFDYGRKKYAEWNWAKGMKWSVPLACAARHLRRILEGESHDAESGETHRGHVYCNIVMLLTFVDTFREGDDLPPSGALRLVDEEPNV